MPGAELEFLHSRIFDIKEDTERNIWIATNYEGIVRINLQDKTYKRYAVGQKRDVQNIFCLLVDSPSADLGRLYVEWSFLLRPPAGYVCNHHFFLHHRE